MINATELERNVMQACLSWLMEKVEAVKNNELTWVKTLGMEPLKAIGNKEVFLSEPEWVITLARLTGNGLDIDWERANYDSYSFRIDGVQVFALGEKDESTREKYATLAGINKDTNDEQEEEEVTRRYGLRMQREKSEDIARNMLTDGIKIEKIAEYTGLSVSEVQALQNLQPA